MMKMNDDDDDDDDDDDADDVEATHAKAPKEQSQTFVYIFGVKGKGMKVVLAVRVILDYGYKFPDILTGGKSSGQARGKIDLTTFVEAEGVKISAIDDDDGRVKIDYEAFIARMKTDRNWDKPQAHGEWAVLDADGSTPRDMKGLKGVMRLHVPSNYFTCLDRTFNRTEDYQLREMQNKKNFKAPMASGDRDRLRQELGRGLRQKTGIEMDRLCEQLPQGAMSSTAGTIENSLQAGLTSILNDVAPSVGASSDSKNKEKESAEAAVEQVAAEVALQDVAAARNKAGAKALRELNGWVVKFVTGVIEAHLAKESCADEIKPEHDQAFVNTLEERLAFSNLFLGVDIKRQSTCPADKAGKDLIAADLYAAPMDFQAHAVALKNAATAEDEKAFFTPPGMTGKDEQAQKEELGIFHAGIHDHLFQLQKKKMKDPPCEDHMQLPCVPHLRLAVQKIQAVKSAEELNKESTFVDDQVTKIKQTKKSLSTAQGDLVRQIRNRQKEAMKKEQDKKKEEDEKLKQQKEGEEQLEKQKGF